MIELYGILQEQESINAELGLGVDYYKGEPGEQGIPGKDGKTPVKGVDYFTDAEINEIEEGAAAKVDLSNYAKTADLSTVATSGSYNDLSDKPSIPSTAGLASTKYVDDKVAGIVIPAVPTKVSAFENDKGYLTSHQDLTEYAKKTDIPAPYTLPTASTSTLGGVKVDGSTITITDGVISSKGGSGGSEPEKYIKDASVSGNTLTLTKKDDTEVVFTPSTNKQSFHYQTKVALTDEQKAQIQKIKENPNDYDMFINNVKIIRITTVGQPVYYFGFSDSSENMRVDRFIVNYDGKFEYRGSDEIITNSNWMQFITVGNDWQYTQDQYDSNLYDAKELVIYVENNQGNKQMGYFNFGNSNLGNSNGDNFYFDYDASSPYISYNGSNLTCGNINNIQQIYYKT